MTAASRRVAITGIGLRTPAGHDPDDVFAAITAAQSTAATIPSLVDSGCPVDFGCLVPPFDLDSYLPIRERQKMERVGHLAVAAATDAMADAGLVVARSDEADGLPAERIGVLVGTSAAGVSTSGSTMAAYVRDATPFSAFTVPRVMSNSVAARLAMTFGAQGPCLTYSTACASGATALGEAVNQIRFGQVDVAIAGGADAALIFPIISSFHKLRALSARNDDPARASRPFDAERDGFVMGEGAAFVVLERWDLAVARGARIHGEVMGYASNCDAAHIVAPRADGVLAARCMRAALRDAGLDPVDIIHVNAHGTSTMHNDDAEARALVTCFPEGCPPVTAPKGVVGHLLGAAGAFEAVVALQAARNGSVPPVANFASDRAPSDIDVVAGGPRAIPRGPAISNSFGFGGHNSCLVVAPN